MSNGDEAALPASAPFIFGTELSTGNFYGSREYWDAYFAATPGADPRIEPVAAAAPTLPVPPVVVAPPTLPPPSSPPVAPPVAPPTSSPPPTPGPASGGLSPESVRQEAERVIRDTDVRRSAPPPRPIFQEGEIVARRAAGGIARVIGRALGPVGVILEVLRPNPLGSGEISVGDMIEQVLREVRENAGTDIARGGGIIAGGMVLGGQVILDRLPAPSYPLGDDDDELVRVGDVPQPSFPDPVIRQPSPLPLPEPPKPALPMPSPAKRPLKTPQGTRSAPTPAPTLPPFPNPLGQVAPWLRVAGALGAAVAVRTVTRRSSLTLPRLNVRPSDTPATSLASSTLPAPSTPLAQTVTSPLTSSLTGFNPQVLGSAPPRLRTRTRTDECECKPKRRKPARECRARAPVVWAGGPNKGKLAGSRCISFKT